MMRGVWIGAAAAVAIGASALFAGTPPTEQSWQNKKDADGQTQIGLRYAWKSAKGDRRWSSWTSIRRDQLTGMPAAAWGAGDTPIQVALRRDAGTFHLTGRMQRGEECCPR